MGLRLAEPVALETLDLCAELRAALGGRVRMIQAAYRRHRGRLIERTPKVPPVIFVAVAVAICAGRAQSRRVCNSMADLSDAEYKRRYALGRRRYLAERAARKAFRQKWIREHGPWLLLAVIAVLLVVVLGLTRPQRFIVIMSLALYSGLAWVVCWAVRASC